MRSAFRSDGVLTLVVLAVLIVGCFLVLQPFLTAIVWAVILCTTLWHLTRWLRGRTGPAALVLVLAVTLTMLTPFVIVGTTIAENADRVSDFVPSAVENGPLEPPA
jgi:predicted PurR-regulated permease PerM